MGMTIEETQKAYCEAAGIPYDKSCITPKRIIFITDKDSEIYRSKEWYGVLPDEEIKARREAFLKRGLTIDGKRTARYSLLAVDCKSTEHLAGDFLAGQYGYSSRLPGIANPRNTWRGQISMFKVTPVFKVPKTRIILPLLRCRRSCRNWWSC